MKIVALIWIAFSFQVIAQTNSDALNFIQWTSQSKTVQAYRQKYPQLTNITDERLVVAIGNKFPQVLLTDIIFSNEFSALTVSDKISIQNSDSEGQITTRKGTVYRGVKILKNDPVGLTISYTNSTKAFLLIKLSFDDLSDYLQQKYHYDPKAAEQFQIQSKTDMAKLRNELAVRDHEEVIAQNQRIDEEVEERHIREQQRVDEQLAQARQKSADAQQRAADAAMVEALKPPAQINQQQNTFLY